MKLPGHGGTVGVSGYQLGVLLITLFALASLIAFTVTHTAHDTHTDHKLKRSVGKGRLSAKEAKEQLQQLHKEIEGWVSTVKLSSKAKRDKYHQMLLEVQQQSTLAASEPPSDKIDSDSPRESALVSSTSLSTKKLHIVTYATHGGRDDRFCRAMESAIRWDIDVVLLGWGEQWVGLSQKLSAAYEYAHSLPADDVILFTDAFDVLYTQPADTILKEFLSTESSILFSAECGCWPHIMEDPKICVEKYPPSPSPYRYLNSGSWIGYSKQASEMLKVVMEEAGDNFSNANDQKLIADLFLANRFGIKLDYTNRVFQAMHMTLDPPLEHCNPIEDIMETTGKDGKLALRNKLTESYPSVFHFNGGGKRYHLQLEGKQWYKHGEHASRSAVSDLASHPVTVNNHLKESTLTFSDICGDYLKDEYSVR